MTMLHLWLSFDRKQNTKQAFSLIHHSYGGGTEQILLVPEQFSHTTQEQFCRSEGDRASLVAQVLDFTRLAEQVFSREGGLADTQTNETGRLLLMSLAVEQVRSRLKIYANAADKPEFLLQLISMLDEFRSFCVSPASLRQASSSLEGVLAQKAEEFALLMESYGAVCENCGQNPMSLLNRLLEVLQESDYPRGKCFYLDGFTDFNGVQLEIITELLCKAEAVHVFLLCPGIEGREQQFDTARHTAGQLLRICNHCEIKYQIHTLREDHTDVFSCLRNRLFSGRIAPLEEENAVSFIQAPDALVQCRITAGQILRLAAAGVRYRDIYIACAQYDRDRPVLESVLRRAKIPAYFAGDTDILKQPLIHMILSALQSACGGMEQETVLSYIKSAFSPLSRERSDCVENYILLWDISGRGFREIWHMHPDGLQEELREEDQLRLRQLEEDRNRAIVPLLHMQERLKSAVNTGEMVLALHDFLQEIEIRERLQEMAQQSFDRGQLQRAQEYVQLYGILKELLEQIYGVLGGSVRSCEEFYAIFRAALSRSTVGTIPANLDCVNIGDLSSQRRCDCAYLFILGTNEGSFPGMSDQWSLLTDRERQSLMDLGIGVSPTATGRLERELAAIDSVLAGPSKGLYLGAAEGKEAYFFRRLRALFPCGTVYSDDSELISRSHRDHLEYLAAHGIQKGTDQELSQELQQIRGAGEYCPENLQPSEVRALYGSTLRLSSSKIDALASCGLYYFLSYGLKAKERKSVQMDPSLYGTFVHYVLEHTTKQVMEEGGFARVSLHRTLEIAGERMEEYTRRELKDLWRSERAEYLFRRNFSEVEAVIQDLHEELSLSNFEPRWFELHFAGRDGDLPEIRIVGEKVTCALEGYVDRADVWMDGDRLYVRVVDYKTGKKSFEFSKVFYGLGLQMLIYLFALIQKGELLCGHKLTPAGVLYFPARVETVTLKSKDELDSVLKKRSAGRKRSGLLLDMSPVLQAMEPTGEGQEPAYLPYKYDKQGQRVGNLAAREQLDLLSRFVFRKVGELGDKLYSGDISADPYTIDGASPCIWCCYQSICREQRKERQLDKIKSTDEFWLRILQEVQSHG